MKRNHSSKRTMKLTTDGNSILDDNIDKGLISDITLRKGRPFVISTYPVDGRIKFCSLCVKIQESNLVTIVPNQKPHLRQNFVSPLVGKKAVVAIASFRLETSDGRVVDSNDGKPLIEVLAPQSSTIFFFDQKLGPPAFRIRINATQRSFSLRPGEKIFLILTCRPLDKNLRPWDSRCILK